jgi:hypothetical protein
MATKHGEKPVVPVDASAGWEKRDVNIRGLFIFAFWMAVVLAVTLVGMHLSFDALKKASPMGSTMSPLVTEKTPRMIPPAPLLQVHPHQELKDYCDAQQNEVTTYGWIDQPSGVVRVPIDRAEDLILAKGLPARSAAESAAANAPMIAPATVAGDTDVQGQCGYLTELTLADKERARAEERKAAEEKEK